MASGAKLHPAYRLSSIARPVDPRYPTNRAVLVLMPVAAVAAGIQAAVRDAAIADVAWSAGAGALTLFLCWAYVRELSPDDNPAAFIAVGLAAIGFGVWGAPSVWLVAVALGMLRIVSRCVGRPALPSDTAIVTLGAIALTLWGIPAAGIIAALGFAMDGLAAAPRRIHLVTALATAAAAAVRIAGHGLPIAPRPPREWLYAGLSAAALLLVAALHPAPASKADITSDRLDRTRVRLALALGAVACLLAQLPGDTATQALYWAASGGVLIGFLAGRFRARDAA